MAFAHDERYARALAEVYGYAHRRVRGVDLLRVGRTWTNTPFSEYGVPLERADEALVAELPRPFRLKVEADEPVERVAGLPARPLGRLARLDLAPETPEDDFLRARDHQIRKALKKAERAGWRAEVAPLEGELLAEFHREHVRHLRDRHGSPPLARRHFEVLARHFGEQLVVARALRGAETGAWLVGYLDPPSASVQITDVVSRPAALPERVADLVHWELVRAARARGLRAFDFGICRYEGQEYYKRKWGSAFRASLLVASDPTDRPADPDAGLYPWLRRAWRLLPLPVCRWLGPPLRKRIGM